MTWWRGMTMVEARRARPADVAPATLAMARAAAKENPALNAYTWLAPATGMQTGHDGPLDGFGAAIKANICGCGWPTDCASGILRGYRSPFDSTAVERLKAAGGTCLGLANMDEFGMGSSCEYSSYGPVQNPWRPGYTAGGSSGGAAAAVAAGLAWFALGSDTGGSVRLPAHCCGIVGLKPTYGRISRYGLVPFASSLDTIGILARGVADAALVLSVLAGDDPRDATCLESPFVIPDPNAPVRGLTLGVPRNLTAGLQAPAAREDFARTLAVAGDLGLKMVDVELPAADEAVRIYLVLSSAEAASNLARYDGSLYGIGPRDQQPARATDDAPGTAYARQVAETRTRGLGQEVKRRILLGTHVLAAGYRQRFYERARARREILAARMNAVLSRVDALILPTAATGAFALGSRLDDPLAMYRTDSFTVPASLAGLPALTIPTGLDEEGLPLSVQLVGPHLGEELLVRLGGVLEQALDFRACKEAPWHRRS